MNLNLVFRDLKNHFKTFLISSFVVIIFIAGIMGMYVGMKENMSELIDTGFYSSIPEALSEALYFHTNQWASVLGFYITYFLYFVPIIAAIYSFILGNALVAKEEQDKTVEYLLSRPISRQQIILSKLVVLFVYTLGINLSAFLTGLICCGLSSAWEYNIKSLMVLHSYGFLYCLFFGCLGLFIAVKMKRARVISGFGMGIVLVLYFVNTLIRIIKTARFVLFITPLHYINLKIISENYAFEAWRLFIFLISISILIILSIRAYGKKDILI
jgi:beta-exotoxin I transport system permease protein